MSDTPIAYAVYPCEQWHKENPTRRHETPYLWHTKTHALESADDTGGRVEPLFLGGAVQRENDDLREFMRGVAEQLRRRAS